VTRLVTCNRRGLVGQWVGVGSEARPQAAVVDLQGEGRGNGDVTVGVDGACMVKSGGRANSRTWDCRK
jgi:hypothetical protein